MFSTKEQKIKQIQIIAEELERSLIAAVQAGVDRNSNAEMNVFQMFQAAIDILELKIKEALAGKTISELLAQKRNTKLDN